MNLRGSGEDGQLGIGDNEEKECVCAVKGLDFHSVRSVVAGSRNSLAICHDGKVSSLLSRTFFFFFHSIALDSLLLISTAAAAAIIMIDFVFVGWLLVVYMGMEPERDTGAPARDQD
jgi:hypothetical protein